jgi:hypothetical protein
LIVNSKKKGALFGVQGVSKEFLDQLIITYQLNLQPPGPIRERNLFLL